MIKSNFYIKKGQGDSLQTPTAPKEESKKTPPKKGGKTILHKERAIKIEGQVKIETFKDGVKIRETEFEKNLVMLGTNTGITLLLQRLIGTNTYSANVTHADFGTGSTPATQADTTLETAVARAVRGSESISGAVASMSFFFPDALLPDGSYNEFGTFIDGTISVDTGQLFNRIVLGSPYVKATGEDTTVRVKFTIT